MSNERFVSLKEDVEYPAEQGLTYRLHLDRVTKDLMKKVRCAVNNHTPGAKLSYSTFARQALRDYAAYVEKLDAAGIARERLRLLNARAGGEVE